MNQARGIRISRQLMEVGKLQLDVANEIGVSRTAVSKWCRGFNINNRHIVKLAEALDCTPEYIRAGK